MTYALYGKTPVEGSNCRYVYKQDVSLFGCRSGLIPKMLQKKLTGGEQEPFPWNINIEDELKGLKCAGHGHTLIIDLKPYEPDNLSLYEIVSVYGYSAHGWTPIMLHLRGLFVDQSNSSEFHDGNDFIRATKDIDEPIFSMMYVNGTMQHGQIIGKWTPPGPSSANSVLLWPEAFAYFVGIARTINGNLFK